MPIVRSIYNALKQVATTVFNSSGSSFDKACFVEFPRKDCWSLGFVVNGPKSEIAREVRRTRAGLRLHADHAEPDQRLPDLRPAPATCARST